METANYQASREIRRELASLEKRKQRAAEMGLDYEQALEQGRKRIARENRRDQQLLPKKQQAVFDQDSLWGSGDTRFTFADWYPERRSNERKAREVGNKAYRLTRQVIEGMNMAVLMAGPAGVGKTSLAMAMVDMFQRAGKHTMFVSTEELTRLVDRRYTYRDSQQELWRVIEQAGKVDVLVLDDLGAEGGTYSQVNSDKFVGVRRDMQDTLFEIANARYNGTRREQREARYRGERLISPVHTTIVTTNNSPEELYRMYPERSLSRILTKDPNHQILFNGLEDMRKI